MASSGIDLSPGKLRFVQVVSEDVLVSFHLYLAHLYLAPFDDLEVSYVGFECPKKVPLDTMLGLLLTNSSDRTECPSMLVYTTGKHGIPSMGSRPGSFEATLMLVKPVEDGNDLIDYHTAGWNFGVTECWMVLYHVVVWGFSSFPGGRILEHCISYSLSLLILPSPGCPGHYQSISVAMGG